MTPPTPLRDVSERPVSHATMAIHIDEFDRRFSALEKRQSVLEVKVDETAKSAEKILEIVESFEVGIRALEFIARIVKPLSIAVASIVGAWAYMKGIRL